MDMVRLTRRSRETRGTKLSCCIYVNIFLDDFQSFSVRFREQSGSPFRCILRPDALDSWRRICASPTICHFPFPITYWLTKKGSSITPVRNMLHYKTFKACYSRYFYHEHHESDCESCFRGLKIKIKIKPNIMSIKRKIHFRRPVFL